MPQHVLDFWFKETSPHQWWANDPQFDETVKQGFSAVLQQALRGELHAWRDTAHGRLAEIIVLDQFSRQIYRHSAQAFAQDAMALVLSQEAVRQNCLATLNPTERSFMLLPFMHSESAPIHAQAEALFRENTSPDILDFELRHRAIITRFGRYPHRNAVLGRVSTPEEIAFLKEPGSSF